MLVEAIVLCDSTRGTALRRNRMAPHRIDFRYHGNAEFGIGFRYGNRCAKTGSATTNQENIVRRDVHYHLEQRLKRRNLREPVENLPNTFGKLIRESRAVKGQVRSG